MLISYTSNRFRYIMSMGNYMRVRGVHQDTMSTKEPTLGMDHPTVRPANFEPETESADEDDPDSEQ